MLQDVHDYKNYLVGTTHVRSDYGSYNTYFRPYCLYMARRLIVTSGVNNARYPWRIRCLIVEACVFKAIVALEAAILKVLP